MSTQRPIAYQRRWPTGARRPLVRPIAPMRRPVIDGRDRNLAAKAPLLTLVPTVTEAHQHTEAHQLTCPVNGSSKKDFLFFHRSGTSGVRQGRSWCMRPGDRDHSRAVHYTRHASAPASQSRAVLGHAPPGGPERSDPRSPHPGAPRLLADRGGRPCDRVRRSAKDLASTPHAHRTLAEAVREAALAVAKRSTHS